MHSSDTTVDRILEQAVALASFEPRSERLLNLVLTLIELGDVPLDRDPAGRADDPDLLLTQQAMTHLRTSYERGWQPLDIVHAARRTSRRMSDLARTAVIAEAQLGGAEDRAPPPGSSSCAPCPAGDIHSRTGSSPAVAAPAGSTGGSPASNWSPVCAACTRSP